MGFKEPYSDKQSYAKAKAKAFKAEQENRKIINDTKHFTLALYESTSEVFKPLKNNQDKSLKEVQNIVKEISDLSKSLKAMKELPKEEKKEQKKEDKKIYNRNRKKKQNIKKHYLETNVWI